MQKFVLYFLWLSHRAFHELWSLWCNVHCVFCGLKCSISLHFLMKKRSYCITSLQIIFFQYVSILTKIIKCKIKYITDSQRIENHYWIKVVQMKDLLRNRAYKVNFIHTSCHYTFGSSLVQLSSPSWHIYIGSLKARFLLYEQLKIYLLYKNWYHEKLQSFR